MKLLGLQLASIQNLSFYLWLVKEARKHIIEGDFTIWKQKMVKTGRYYQKTFESDRGRKKLGAE
jgi:queuine/archaeosine tRNA-ribosyltransferase